VDSLEWLLSFDGGEEGQFRSLLDRDQIASSITGGTNAIGEQFISLMWESARGSADASAGPQTFYNFKHCIFYKEVYISKQTELS